jgi:hypothetical protein
MNQSHDVLGVVYLRPDLLSFLVKTENLDPKNPVLDLTKSHTIIRYQLRMSCKKMSDLHIDKKIENKFVSPLKFKPSKGMLDTNRIYLDAGETEKFNFFLQYLRNDFASIYARVSLKPQKRNLRTVYQDFLTDNFLDDQDFDIDGLKQAEFRLNRLRSQSR